MACADLGHRNHAQFLLLFGSRTRLQALMT
jgi:hypothetical protein